MPLLDWAQCPEVESVPGKVSGAWVLKGTRMPVSAIFENLEAGANIDDILEWFDGLKREQVQAVIEFGEQLRARRADRLFSAMDRMAGVGEPAVMSPEEVAMDHSEQL